MARIFTFGGEGGTSDITKFSSVSGATVISSAGLGMDGNYCLECSGQLYYTQQTISAVSALYAAFLYRPDTIATNSLIAFFLGGTIILQLRRAVSGVLQVYAGSTLVAASSATISINTTHFIETYCTVANSGGRFVVKVNGIVVIDFTGDTQPGADTTFNSVILGAANTVYGYAYYDNIILDTTSWIGKTYIQGLAVTGAGTTTQMTASAGSNYACVDEIPASGTDYVYTNTNDHIDTYAAGNLTGTIGTIKSVSVNVLAKKEGAATPQNLQAAVRSGGTNYFSSSIALPTTSAVLQGIWETDPATAAAWTESNVNAVEIGQKVVA